MVLQIPQGVYPKLFDRDFQWMLRLVDIEYLSAFFHQLLQTHVYICSLCQKESNVVFWVTIEFS